MPKKNHMLAQMEAKMEIKYAIAFERRSEVLAQMLMDAAMLAAHDVFGLGPGRAAKFMQAVKDSFQEMEIMALKDADDGDQEIWYTRAKLDEQLRAIVGEENFKPFEVRYGHEKAPETE